MLNLTQASHLMIIKRKNKNLLLGNGLIAVKTIYFPPKTFKTTVKNPKSLKFYAKTNLTLTK